MSKRFYNEFEMQVRLSSHKLRRMKPRHLRTDVWNTQLSDELVWNLTDAAEEVDCFDVVIPKDKLDELENMLEHYKRAEETYRKGKSGEVFYHERKDERVRIKNPAVAKAYAQYLTLLNLCRES